MEMGFHMKLEGEGSVLEKFQFCQTHIVETATGYVQTRIPQSAIGKDMTCLKTYTNEKGWNTQRKSVGLCGSNLAGDQPVWQAFYRMLERGAGDRIDKETMWGTRGLTGFEIMSKGMKRKGWPIADATRVSFFKAFDIDPTTQILLEDLFDSVTLEFGDDIQANDVDITLHSLLTL